jgi:hypothetical protein
MRSLFATLFSFLVVASAYAQTTAPGGGTAGGTGAAAPGAGTAGGLGSYWWIILVVIVLAVVIWMMSRRRRTM